MDITKQVFQIQGVHMDMGADKESIMQANVLSSLLVAFGSAFGKGKLTLFKKTRASLDGLAETLQQMTLQCLANSFRISKRLMWTCSPSRSVCICRCICGDDDGVSRISNREKP